MDVRTWRAAARAAVVGAVAAVAFGVGSGDPAVGSATCTIAWDGGAGTSSWHAAVNWSGDRLPNATDHVCIPDMTPNVAVTHSSGITNLLSLQADERVTLSGGTLNLTSSSDPSELRSGFTQSGGILDGPSPLFISGTFIWSGGTQDGPGSTHIPAGATATFSLTQGFLYNGRTLTNDGTITWTSGDLFSGQGTRSTFVNNGSITMTNSGAFSLVGCCGGALVHNLGSITKTTSTGTSSWSVPMDNDGTITVDKGTLNLFGGGGGTISGSYVVVPGATIEFAGSLSYTLDASSSVTGGGTLRTSATVSMAGALDVGSTTVTNGTATFTGPAPMFGDPVTVTNGSAVFNTSFSVPRLVQSGGRIAGTAAIEVGESFLWSGGTQDGPGSTHIPAGVTATFSLTQGFLYNGRTFTNDGTITWTSGDLFSGQGNQSTIRNGGTFTIVGDRSIFVVGCCGGSKFVNTGTFVKSSGTGTSQVQSTFTNTGGTVRALSGRLDLTTLTNFASSTKTLTGGTYEIRGTLEVTGIDVVRNAAAIVLDGSSARFVDQTNADALRNLSTNLSDGSLSLGAGANVSLPRVLTNAGLVEVHRYSTLLTSGYMQIGGSTVLTDVTSRLGGSASAVDIRGGTLSGIGNVGPAIAGGGTVSPGLSPGLLTVTGDYSPTGTLAVEIGARSDRLDVTGSVTLGGTLALTTIDDPQDGDRIPIINGGSVTGAFDDVTGVDIGNGLFYDVIVSDTTVELVVRRPGLSVVETSAVEGTTANFEVHMIPAPRVPVSVAYATHDGSATAPDDYAARAGVLTFAPGETVHTVEVPTTGDEVDEPNESFEIVLSNAVNASIVDDSAFGTIVDDDADCTIVGTDADDVLIGTPWADVICGLGGNDVIIGLAGDDILVGGDGDDDLSGGAGSDRLNGDAGDDTLAGGYGADVARGGSGADEIVVVDGAGDDVVDGGDDTDACYADEQDSVTGCP